MAIDLHHHWMPEEHFRNIERYLGPRDRVERSGDVINIYRDGIHVTVLRPERFGIEQQLRDMDEARIDAAVIHLATWTEWLTMESAPAVNDAMADMVSRHPGRFIGLAHVPVGEEGYLAELDRAVKVLGLKGVGINSHIRGATLDSETIWPFYAKVAELGVPIVVHPATMPAEHQTVSDLNLARGLGRVQDLTTATVRLLASGVLDRFPSIKFVMSHLGGAFFAVKNRLAPEYYGGGQLPFDKHLDQFLFDTAPPLWGGAELQCALELLGPGRIGLGSDYPLRSTWMKDAVAWISKARLDEATKRRILHDNAAALFGLL